ncbi:MAG: ABC transporter ATP-binding protein [Flavobacteriaceae bacterium]|nr:ABC transporter ATP-binding protein [Flavobacteriaceae bacterium]
MSDIILKAQNISKQYRLGLIGTGTLSHDLNRWWHKVRGKDDPFLKVGETNDRSSFGKSDYVWALQDINFELKRGEVLGIIGKNGAGKSTLLKILSRVTSPTTGEIKTKGRIASLLEVGTGFHPEMTGRENIYLNGAILGMTKKEIRSKEDEIIDFSGCQRYIDTPVKRYSSGMRVRLAFAVAAHLEPDILVIDEVLAVGDAEFQKKAIGKMQDISSQEGRTVLFVSHNMASVKSLCTRGILLENGEIKLRGNIDDVVDEYLKRDSEITFFKELTNYPRKSKGKNVMTSIEVIANNDEIIAGEDLTFRIHFETSFINNVTLGYLLKDEMGVSVHAANMQQYGIKYQVKPKKNIDIILQKLPLNPGKYSVSLYFGNGTYDIDIVEDVLLFQVFWKKDTTVIPPQKKWGKVYIDTNWNY